MAKLYHDLCCFTLVCCIAATEVVVVIPVIHFNRCLPVVRYMLLRCGLMRLKPDYEVDVSNEVMQL